MLYNPLRTLKRLVIESNQDLAPVVDVWSTLFTGVDVELIGFKWAQTNTVPAVQRMDCRVVIDGEEFTAIGILPASAEIVKHMMSNLGQALGVNPFLDEFGNPDSIPFGYVFDDGGVFMGINGLFSGRAVTIDLRTDLAPAAGLQYDMDIVYFQYELG